MIKTEGLEAIRIFDNHPYLIAGPCSAETYDQLYGIAKALKAQGVKVIRAGVWKPRTRPNNFEGIGVEALGWIKEIKEALSVQFAIEVASARHVDQALEHGIDMLWIGARSTVNPFTVQEIADSLKGVDMPIFIKNPVNPDLGLWIGAVERIANAGISQLGVIHRGFSSSQESRYRNMPMWSIAIELKRRMPHIPMICDPSHIAGDRSIIGEIAQKALDLNYDGLMVEVHHDPDKAWSDAKQQITPASFKEIVTNLKVRSAESQDVEFIHHLEDLRAQIDDIDLEIFDVLAKRMKVVDAIGHYKRNNNVTIFQVTRWNEILQTRARWAEELGLNKNFMADLFSLIHDASIRRQTAIMNEKDTDAAS